MKFFKILLLVFTLITMPIKADSNKSLIDELKQGGKIIFIRHAYAPGNGDPDNFDKKDCSTQRNLNDQGIQQSKMIGQFFSKNLINIEKVFSSEWCRCKDTAKNAFYKFETFDALNSFYDHKFIKNKDKQISDLKRFINNWNNDGNIIFVTHYVVIAEMLGVGIGSGEIIVSDKKYKIKGRLQVDF